MQIGMRQVSSETVEWFGMACKGGDLTRTALARELCELENWHGRVGRPCLASARKLLPTLAERLGVRLPEATALDPHDRPAPDFPDSSVACALGDLGALSLAPVTDAEVRRHWEAMIETHHPEGWRRPPGGQLRYWVRSERHGVLGGIGFTAAGIQLGPRDGVIGWSADARVANIGKVVCNNRFLLLGGVRVKDLASRVLCLATARVASDWAAAYGERPVLARTFTGPEMSGLSYRAAGWRFCPDLTSGRRSGVRRAVWLRPLSEGLAPGPAPRTGKGSRLVRIDVQRGGLGRAGVRPEHAPRQQGQEPDRADGRGLGPAPRRAPAGDLPGAGGTGGGLPGNGIRISFADVRIRKAPGLRASAGSWGRFS